MAIPGVLATKAQTVMLLAGAITNDITDVCTFEAGTAYGARGTVNFAWPVSNDPDFSVVQEEYNTKILTGRASKTHTGGWSNIIMRKHGETQYDFDGNAYSLAVPLRGLTQRGFAEGDLTPFTKAFTVPTSLRTTGEGLYPEFYLYLARYMNATNYFLMEGCVTKSITLSSDGGPLKCSASFIGRTPTNDSVAGVTSLASASLVVDPRQALLWRNAVVRLDDSDTDDANVNCSGFSLTVDGGWTPVFGAYAGDGVIRPRKFMPGAEGFSISGSLKFPYEALTYDAGMRPWLDYMASDVAAANVNTLKPSRTLTIFWGSVAATTAGELSIVCEVLFDKPVASAENEHTIELPFTAYSAAGSGVEPCTITLSDAVETV